MDLLSIFEEIKKKLLKKENIYFFSIIIIIFFLDRISKIKIINTFNENVYYLNDYINFDLIWNLGVGFGFLSTSSSLFYNLVTVLIGMVILFLSYFFIISENIDKFIYSIIIGGALGNFYDRMIYRAVPDYIDIHYGNFHWFTFNVADIFISVGILIFVIRSFFVKN
tara:strand:+ start:1228 stop:1728 length:501 start_codon:yes stop_codon:yes gene_type:complete